MAAHVLGHPDFTARDAAILQPDEAENLHVQFRSGPHTLIASRIEGNYPNYRCVVPHEFLADGHGSTLRLSAGISPGLVTDPTVENYCVLMPCRCVAEDAADESPDQAMAA